MPSIDSDLVEYVERDEGVDVDVDGEAEEAEAEEEDAHVDNGVNVVGQLTDQPEWHMRPTTLPSPDTKDTLRVYLTSYHYDVVPDYGPRLHCYGVTADRRSVCFVLYEHMANFALEVPAEWTRDECDTLYYGLLKKVRASAVWQLNNARERGRDNTTYHKALEQALGGDIKPSRPGSEFYVAINEDVDPDEREIDVLEGYEIEHCHALTAFCPKGKGEGSTETRPFMRIRTRFPQLVRKCRELVETCRGGWIEGRNGERYEKKPWLDRSLWDDCGNDPHFPLPRVYEANIAYCDRVRLDHRIVSEKWVDVPLRDVYAYDESIERTSFCQLEYHMPATAVQPVEELGDPAPMLTMSFDIEAMPGDPLPNNPRKRTFPDAKRDRVIGIAQTSCFVDEEGKKQRRQVSFILGSVNKARCEKARDANIASVNVYTFPDTEDGERALLMSWCNYVRVLDPDRIIGYNTDDFDFVYLIDRAKTLGIGWQFRLLGRNVDRRDMYREKMMEKRKMKALPSGKAPKPTRPSYEMSITGRVCMDIYKFAKMLKLRSYTLNNVAAVELGETKDDLSYDLIPELQTNRKGRTRLTVYGLRDTVLPLDIAIKRNVDAQYAAVARVTGIDMQSSISRGQQCRVGSCVLWFCKKKDPLIGNVTFNVPVRLSAPSTVVYEGAFVLPPRAGLYPATSPVITLDFSSLYPSLQQQNNYSPDAKIAPDKLDGLKRGETYDFEKQMPVPELAWDRRKYPTYDQYITNVRIPWEERNGYDYFVPMDYEEGGEGRDYWFRWVPGKTHAAFCAFRHRIGVDVAVLIAMGAMRNADKAMMKKYAPNSYHYNVYDAAQASKKIVNNSVYGTRGTGTGPHSDLEVAAAVTHGGRGLIKFTRYRCQQEFTRANGYGADALVIGIDTDSNMLLMEGLDVSRLDEIGKRMQEHAAGWFTAPHVLEYEKAYLGCIFFPAKKRYCYLIRKAFGQVAKKITATGLELERRDTCRLMIRMMERVLYMIIVENDMEGAKQYVRDETVRLMRGEVDFHELIISKLYSKADYATDPIHVGVVRRMERRDPGSAPKIGTRVRYVVERELTEKSRQLKDCGEDPTYAWENRTPLDFNYIREKQLAGPIGRIFSTCGLDDDEVHELFYGEHTKPARVQSRVVHKRTRPAAKSADKLRDEAERKATRKRQKSEAAARTHGDTTRQMDMRSFFGGAAPRVRTVSDAQLAPPPPAKRQAQLVGVEYVRCQGANCSERVLKVNRFCVRCSTDERMDELRAEMAPHEQRYRAQYPKCIRCLARSANEEPPCESVLRAKMDATMDIEDLDGAVAGCKQDECDGYWERVIPQRRLQDLREQLRGMQLSRET